ncbi:hypothetical protein [Caproiciproducens sp.]
MEEYHGKEMVAKQREKKPELPTPTGWQLRPFALEFGYNGSPEAFEQTFQP